MPEFEVRVIPEEFEITGGESVVGPIWVRIAGADFPESGWPDFPVAVLGGWLTKLAELTDTGTGTAIVSLNFMDGPYRLDVARRPNGWAMSARYGDDAPEAEITVDTLSALRTPLRAAASQVVAACHVRGWHGRDVSYLESVAKPRP